MYIRVYTCIDALTYVLRYATARHWWKFSAVVCVVSEHSAAVERRSKKPAVALEAEDEHRDVPAAQRRLHERHDNNKGPWIIPSTVTYQAAKIYHVRSQVVKTRRRLVGTQSLAYSHSHTLNEYP